MARIALFDDDPSVQRLVQMAAEMEGHKIVAAARNVVSALAVLASVKSGEIVPPPDAYLVDGNLTPGDASGNDARTIVGQLRALGLTGQVIGFSSSPMSEYGVEVDYDAKKDPFKALDYLAQPVA